MEKNPIKIGHLIDVEPFEDDWRKVLRFTIDEYLESGRIDRPIEIVERTPYAFPRGTAAELVRAHHELVAEDVLVICGGAVGDNHLALAPTLAKATVPTAAITATMPWLSEYAFSVPWGSEVDCPYLLNNWLWRQGHKTAAVMYDTAKHSVQYLEHFRLAAERYGIKIVTAEQITAVPGERQMAQSQEAIKSAQGHNPDALVDLCMSVMSSYAVARSAWEATWNIPRIMAGDFYTCWDDKLAGSVEWMHLEGANVSVLEVMEGWVGATIVDPENPVANDFFHRFRESYGEPPNQELGRILYDVCRAVLEGLALAPLMTPEGVKEGLERLRMLPAASGGPRSVLSLGPYDHRGLKGMDMMVLNRVENGEILMEGRFEH